MKLLKPNPHLVGLMGMENIRELFIREAATMANLRHPNLLDIWDFDLADGMPFYIMEYYCNNLGTMIGESYEVERPSRRIRTAKAVHYWKNSNDFTSPLRYSFATAAPYNKKKGPISFAKYSIFP